MIYNYGDMLGNALASGLNTGMRMGQLVDQRRQREAAQLQQQEAEARQQAALQQASQLYSQGTPDQIAEFALQNPEAGQLLQRQMQFKSDATKQNMMSGMRDIMTNPGKTEDILKNRIAMVEEAGGDASDTIADLAHFQQDPDSYRQTVEKSFAMMDPQGYAAFRRAGPQEAQPLTALERATLKDKALDRQLKMMEFEDKKLSRQLKRETDDLKRQEIEQKLTANKLEQEKAVEQAQVSEQDAQVFANEVYDVVQDILKDPSLEDATGALSSMFPTFSDETQDVINKAQRLEAMLTKENLGLMKGVLTDKDIKMLRDISSGMNVTDSGIKGSEKETRRRLNEIANKMVPGGRKPAGVQQNAAGGYTSSKGVSFSVE